MRHHDAPRQGWPGGLLRLIGSDRNPMRRGTDRIQAVLRAVLLVVFLAGAPAGALAVSNAIYVSGLRAGQAQLAAWHRVPAVVLGAKPVATGWWYDMRSPMRLSVGWADPGGSWRTGEVTVPRGVKAGGTTAVWIDAQGRLTRTPLSRAEVTDEVIRAAVAVPVALGLLLAGIGGWSRWCWTSAGWLAGSRTGQR